MEEDVVFVPTPNYLTRNTALAAYLRIKGIRLLDVVVQENGSPAVFVFEPSEEIQELEQLWQTRRASGNFNDWFESYRLCLRMVKVGKL